MKTHKTLLAIALLISTAIYAKSETIVPIRHEVNLDQAHIGNLKIDTMLLNSYEKSAPNVEQYYICSREIFAQQQTDFSDKRIIAAAKKHGIKLMGMPMLGNLTSEGVSLWIRPANTDTLTLKITRANKRKTRTINIQPETPGKSLRIKLNGLNSNTTYNYTVANSDTTLAKGQFTSAPKHASTEEIKIAFGSCFHKIGLHNPQLINSIVARKPHAMLLLGDIAVDDREGKLSMHRADYMLRDLSPTWQHLAANVPIYTNWDDHDYRNNDLNGISGNFSHQDRENLRMLWTDNWNNPPRNDNNIYFSTRIGQVEFIMLDTRSCRTVSQRGKYNSYLGAEQQEWLKNVLRNSTARFKIISSGTMWSDNITNGKDSWGTWDKQAREEIFSLIEAEQINGTLLISGDRHGARGMIIPRPSGFKFYEFEAASLGGVPGPPAMGRNPNEQLFGYKGAGLKAFGEFTFDCSKKAPSVTFRLISESGIIMEEHKIMYEELSPR